LADAIILAKAVHVGTQALITGGVKQYEEEWKDVTEIKIVKLADFVKTL
jgi:hypothetical protein